MPPESVAARRELLFGSISFTFFALSSFAAIEFYSIREIVVGHNWSSIFPVIMGPVVGAMVGALAAIPVLTVLRRWHFRQAVYRCYRCHQPLPYKGHCACWLAENPQFARSVEARKHLPWRYWRHVRQQMPRFARIALALFLPAAVVAFTLPVKNHDALWVKVGVLYGTMLHLIGLVGIVASDFLKKAGAKRRFRLRFQLTFELMLMIGTALFLSVLYFHLR